MSAHEDREGRAVTPATAGRGGDAPWRDRAVSGGRRVVGEKEGCVTLLVWLALLVLLGLWLWLAE